MRIDNTVLLWNYKTDFSLIPFCVRVPQAGFYFGLLSFSSRIEPWLTLGK